MGGYGGREELKMTDAAVESVGAPSTNGEAVVPEPKATVIAPEDELSGKLALESGILHYESTLHWARKALAEPSGKTEEENR